MNLAIVIPTYNESKNIIFLIQGIFSILENTKDVHTHLYIVDDSSPDNTSGIALSLSKQFNRDNFDITVFNRSKKEGLGAAYIDAISRLNNSVIKFDYILQMDADLSHNPAYIPIFLEKAKDNFDFVIGSRYVKGGDTPDWIWYRKLISLLGNFYARIMLDSRITDYTGGFNLYASYLLNSDTLSKVNTNGYGFLISLKYFCAKNSKNLCQIPIIFTDRRMGVSKMPVSTFLNNFILVLKIRLDRTK
ncbi:MAG: polyprenol monophosphomannose synthase [Candidatus Staskawiczbacteria bacterium]|nr:polyprenol monophosphomannose synthase [Candidatus Staskawiczbacteria bacterium]